MWIPVAKLEQFQNGRLVVKVEGEKTPVLLLYTGQEIFAISDICTHDKNPLSDGPVEGDTIQHPRQQQQQQQQRHNLRQRLQVTKHRRLRQQQQQQQQLSQIQQPK